MADTIDSAPRSAYERPPLSVERIVDAAVSLVEREGTGALSMRRLGAELGVEGMALYHHLAGRDELLRAIAGRLLQPLQYLELGDHWREACWRFAATLRGIAVAHAATFRLVGLEPLDTAALLAPVERLLALLVAEGFAPSDALAVYRAVVSYALAEATGFTVDAEHAGGRRRLAALSREEFPILAGRADELAALDADTGFERGLRALLAGLPDPR